MEIEDKTESSGSPVLLFFLPFSRASRELKEKIFKQEIKSQ